MLLGVGLSLRLVAVRLTVAAREHDLSPHDFQADQAARGTPPIVPHRANV